MPDTTFERAKRCPKCGTPGEDRKTLTPGRELGVERGTTVHGIVCTNALCSWFETSWMVQVRADGSVPAANSSPAREKAYPTRARSNESVQSVSERVRTNIRNSQQ